MDGGRGGLFIAHPKLDDFLVRAAEEHKIPHHLEVLIGGSTDAQAIAFRRAGIPATTISIPTRYVHFPVELLNVSDAVGAADLLAAALAEVDSGVLRSLSFRQLRSRKAKVFRSGEPPEVDQAGPLDKRQGTL